MASWLNTPDRLFTIFPIVVQSLAGTSFLTRWRAGESPRSGRPRHIAEGHQRFHGSLPIGLYRPAHHASDLPSEYRSIPVSASRQVVRRCRVTERQPSRPSRLRAIRGRQPACPGQRYSRGPRTRLAARQHGGIADSHFWKRCSRHDPRCACVVNHQRHQDQDQPDGTPAPQRFPEHVRVRGGVCRPGSSAGHQADNEAARRVWIFPAPCWRPTWSAGAGGATSTLNGTAR